MTWQDYLLIWLGIMSILQLAVNIQTSKEFELLSEKLNRVALQVELSYYYDDEEDTDPAA